MDVGPDTPLLWVIRERLRLTGTKFGWWHRPVQRLRTVHFNGTSVRACSVPVGDAIGRKITTIEGLQEAATAFEPNTWLTITPDGADWKDIRIRLPRAA